MNLLRRSILLISLATASLSAAPLAEGQSASPANTYKKVLFFGNSITKHGPKADIGWDGNWGMAASTEAKDYVHLVTKALREKSGKAPEVMVQGAAEFERGYASFDVAAKLQDAIGFGGDLIIVAMGENVPALKSAEEKANFQSSVLHLLKALKGDRKATLLMRSSFWANEAKDDALKQACNEVGGIYVDISSLGKDEANYARSERQFKHEGVARHPGDRGMQAIADALLKALPQ
jgi:hypothetical protein